MHILILDAYFKPESIAFTHLENDLIDGFINAGHDISIVCPTPTRGISPETARKYRSLKHEEMRDGHVHVRRFLAPHEKKNPIVRAFRYIWCNLREYQIAKKYNDIDFIFANSTPPTQGLLCSLVKRKLTKKYKKNVPFIFDLQDIFPDSMINAKMTKKNSLIWKIGRRIENYTYKNADKIIVISEDFKRNISAKGVAEEKIVLIPNWVNTDDVYPIDRKDNIIFDRYNLDRDRFYVCYSGNIGHSQNMRLLIDVAKSLRNELPDLRFVLIGDGAIKKEVEQTVHDEKIDNIIMLPFQPYEDIAHVFSLGDAGLIISKPGIGGSSVPSKTWSIMAAERPIIASFDEESELANLIKKSGCGMISPSGNADKMKLNIIFLYNARKEAFQMGIAGKKYLISNVSKEVCVQKHLNLMQQDQNKLYR